MLMVLPEIETRGLDGAVEMFLQQNRAELNAHRQLYNQIEEEARGFLSAAYKIFA